MSRLAQVMACCQAAVITWANLDFSLTWLVRFCDIHLRAISQWLPKLLFCIMSLKSILLKLVSHLPGSNESESRPCLSYIVNTMSAYDPLHCQGIISPVIGPVFLEYCSLSTRRVNTLRPRQNGCLFAYSIFKCIFLNENVIIFIQISLEFVSHKHPNYNKPALV